jgi:hypothetical protein
MVVLAVVGSLLVSARGAQAVQPASELLPATTKGYLSIPSVETMRARFSETQLGQLAEDEVMKPFAEDLRRQFRDRFSRTDARLGIDWDDLEGMYAGEACLAMVQPENDREQHAMVLMVDATGHDQQVEALLTQIDQNLRERQAELRNVSEGDMALRVYRLPKRAGEVAPREIVLYSAGGWFVATDHIAVAAGILQRLGADEVATGTLASHPGFVAVMSRIEEAALGLPPDVRWYCEPFAYAEIIRAATSGPRKRGTPLVTILERQGFDAIRAAGGHVNFATEQHDLLHRTFVHAPPADTGGPTKYRLAARMLDFPTTDGLTSPGWIPRELATFLTMNWKLQDAFRYCVTLVDDVVGDEGFFDDVLESIKSDPNGPQIDLRAELVAHLGDRVTLLSDYELPISPHSERLLFALDTVHPEQVRAALKKIFENDPQARQIDVDGHVVWEIIREQEEAIPDLEISIGPPVPGQVPDDSSEEEVVFPNLTMTVMHGHLLVATHVDLLATVLRPRASRDTLEESADYQFVNEKLEALGAGRDSLRFFSRTDEEYRATYELIREGKMPESETVLGRMLNRIFGPEEEGVLRKQQLDGHTLPEYQIVRRYLGPAGLYVRPVDDGWFATGIVVDKKLVEVERQGQEREPLTTAAKP